jgi:hypothetical protein
MEVRARRYLNNVVEQDHRAIKQRCAPMLGLKGFRSAAITLAGVELAHCIRKQQYSLPVRVDGRASSLKGSWAAALVASDVPGRCRSDRDAPMHQNSGTGPEWPRASAHRRAGSIPAQDLLRRKSVSARSAPGRAVLALPLPDGGKRKTLSLGTYPDVPVAIAPRGGCSRRAAVRRCGGAICG